MKYIKLFEAWNEESEWDREKREEKETKTKELMQYTINGLKVIGTESFESCGSGFELENKDVILVEWYSYSNRITYYKFEDGDYHDDSYQDAASEYDYTYTYKKWKSGNFDPIFKTKNDAQTFMYLFKKYYSEYESYENVKIKLKYIFTPDVKETKRKEINESDFDQFIGKKFTFKEYGTFGDVENYEIKSIKFKEGIEKETIYLSFDMESDSNKHILMKGSVVLSFFVAYNNDIGKIRNFDPSLTKFRGFSKPEEWDYTKFPEVVNFAKEIKKMLEPEAISEPKQKKFKLKIPGIK